MTSINLRPFKIIGKSAFAAIALLVVACGGGSASPPPTYIVGGSVTGLLPGTSVMLQNNGTNSTPVSVNASFTFSIGVASGSPDAVKVATQPTGENCTVTNGSGVVAAANVSVAVACTPQSYTIGGNVAGLLPGNSVVLANNGGNSTTVAANGAFTFSKALASDSTYAVAISSQSPGQRCAVTGGSGMLAGANVTNVKIKCLLNSYTVSAAVFGLLPNTTVTLQDNGGGNLTVSSSGTVNFKTPILSGSSYAVTVLTQPVGETCIVNGGSGTVVGSNVTVSVVCPWHVAYVADIDANAISAYYIDPVTGALLPLAGSPFPAASYPTLVAVTPNGQFAVVANQGGAGSVSVFSIAPATGALASIAGSPFAAGSHPEALAIDPNGQFVYVGNQGVAGNPPNGISSYTMNSTTGSLTEIPGSQLSALPGPVPLILDPNGLFLFTWAQTYSPATYAVNTTSGALSCLCALPQASTP
jgi:Lactonase, 7-bladed beta-propeller